MAETTELVGLTLARQAELLHCTALVGRSELIDETGLTAGFALVLVAPAELIESTETLEILVALTAGMPIALPAAPTELAEILEPVELLVLTALLAEPLGPVGLVGPLAGLAGLVQLTELPIETPTGLIVGLLAGLVGHPYSRR